MGCYIRYSEEGTGRGRSPPRPLLAVPNITIHPSTASVPITVLLYNGPLVCGFNVPILGLNYDQITTIQSQLIHRVTNRSAGQISLREAMPDGTVNSNLSELRLLEDVEGQLVGVDQVVGRSEVAQTELHGATLGHLQATFKSVDERRTLVRSQIYVDGLRGGVDTVSDRQRYTVDDQFRPIVPITAHISTATAT